MLPIIILSGPTRWQQITTTMVLPRSAGYRSKQLVGTRNRECNHIYGYGNNPRRPSMAGLATGPNCQLAPTGKYSRAPTNCIRPPHIFLVNATLFQVRLRLEHNHSSPALVLFCVFLSRSPKLQRVFQASTWP